MDLDVGLSLSQITSYDGGAFASFLLMFCSIQIRIICESFVAMERGRKKSGTGYAVNAKYTPTTAEFEKLHSHRDE